MYHFNQEDYDSEVEDLKAEVRVRAKYMRELLAYPSCQDPGHPGCEHCEPEDEDEDDESEA